MTPRDLDLKEILPNLNDLWETETSKSNSYQRGLFSQTIQNLHAKGEDFPENLV